MAKNINLSEFNVIFGIIDPVFFFLGGGGWIPVDQRDFGGHLSLKRKKIDINHIGGERGGI